MFSGSLAGHKYRATLPGREDRVHEAARASRPLQGPHQ